MSSPTRLINWRHRSDRSAAWQLSAVMCASTCWSGQAPGSCQMYLCGQVPRVFAFILYIEGSIWILVKPYHLALREVQN